MPDPAARNLLPALIDGLADDPPWARFMQLLVAETGARGGSLHLALGGVPRRRIDAGPDPIDHAALVRLDLPPRVLRAGRIYALDELLAHGDRARLAAQRAGLGALRIDHARWLRVAAADAQATLVLVRARSDFGGGAVALLATVAQHLIPALHALAAYDAARLRAALAEAALDRLGIGQVLLDGAARVIAIDPAAAQALPIASDPATRRLNLHPEAARALNTACAALAGDPHAAPAIVRIGGHGNTALLLRRADLPESGAPAIIGTMRHDAAADIRAAVRVLAACHGLSINEAALAHALAMGTPLVEAGARLRLSAETTRNYSKRIYAKTGTRGQADLVRLVLAGLAPLA